MQYRRARVDGGTYFFTVNVAERRRSLLVDYLDVLRKGAVMVKECQPFTIDTMVRERMMLLGFVPHPNLPCWEFK